MPFSAARSFGNFSSAVAEGVSLMASKLNLARYAKSPGPHARDYVGPILAGQAYFRKNCRVFEGAALGFLGIWIRPWGAFHLSWLKEGFVELGFPCKLSGTDYGLATMKQFSFAFILLLASFCASIGQSKYSGIYSGTVAGNDYYYPAKFLAAATAGGRIIGLTEYSEGIYETLNPARSTVSSKGKITAVAPSGTSMSASINSKFQITGTLKASGMTTRFNGNRIYK